MEISNLGTALKFAIDIETSAQNMLERCARNEEQEDVGALFLGLAHGNKRRKEMIETLYKESIYSDQDTGIFEPISGLAGYVLPAGASDADSENLAQLLEWEEKAHRFYLDFAAVLKSRRRALSRRFEDMSKENWTRKQKLVSLQGTAAERG